MLHSDGTVASVAASACLTVLNVTAELSPIIAADCATALAWVEYEGYWMPKSRNGTIKATLDGHKRSMVRVGDGPDPDGRRSATGRFVLSAKHGILRRDFFSSLCRAQTEIDPN
jgi:hypothetical protein